MDQLIKSVLIGTFFKCIITARVCKIRLAESSFFRFKLNFHICEAIIYFFQQYCENIFILDDISGFIGLRTFVWKFLTENSQDAVYLKSQETSCVGSLTGDVEEKLFGIYLAHTSRLFGRTSSGNCLLLRGKLNLLDILFDTLLSYGCEVRQWHYINILESILYLMNLG